MEEKKKKKGKKGGLRLFLKLIWDTKPPKWSLGLAVVLSVLSTVVSLFVPLLTKGVVDSFSLSSINGGQFAYLALFFVLQALASGFSIYLLGRAGQFVVAQIRDRLWKKLLALKMPYYDRNRTGETVSRMTNDTAVVKGLITEHVTGFFNGIISIVGAVVILLALDWRMTLLMLLAVPVTAAVLVPIGRKMLGISKDIQDETAKFTSVLNQALSEIRLAKPLTPKGANTIAAKRRSTGCSGSACAKAKSRRLLRRSSASS